MVNKSMTIVWTEADLPRPPGGAGLPMQQHPTHGAVCAALGRSVRWLDWHERGKVLGSAQVLSRNWSLVGRVALISRGPVFAPDLPEGALRDAHAALINGLRADHRGVIVTPEPVAGVDPVAGGPWLSMMTGGHVARLSLGPDACTLRAGLHQKWRNRLRRAESAGLTLAEAPLPDDPAHWLLREEAAQARARRYGRLPPAYALAWARAGETLLVSAHAGGRPVAGMLFLIHPPWASYHLGWTSAAGRAANAHNLIMWRAILALKAQGITALELGLLDTENAPDLARFKLGTGAEGVPLGATMLDAPGSRAVAALARAAAFALSRISR
ncbi:GNAT family N-acetyltransferase [Rhodovulum tesquicola]|uniref:GNAT family N-acetyltransferase n=1 Tax=Rhodovulum tesquicola TaxID=540254 RepID=UPI002098353D|nr:GNAT family N-acetyltransferase [Rhodovulum tesquicola]MCO8146874.1 GNAT family N-acetyltransferase [Rhodovulum tesquicola]